MVRSRIHGLLTAIVKDELSGYPHVPGKEAAAEVDDCLLDGRLDKNLYQEVSKPEAWRHMQDLLDGKPSELSERAESFLKEQPARSVFYSPQALRSFSVVATCFALYICFFEDDACHAGKRSNGESLIVISSAHLSDKRDARSRRTNGFSMRTNAKVSSVRHKRCRKRVK
jgi:hypothetical protein